MKIGDRVRIIDYSDAHGDLGKIDTIQSNGLVLVLLDEGCVWPVAIEEIELAAGE